MWRRQILVLTGAIVGHGGGGHKPSSLFKIRGEGELATVAPTPAPTPMSRHYVLRWVVGSGDGAG